MKRLYLLLLASTAVIALMAAPAAFAEEEVKVPDNIIETPPPNPNCDLAPYKHYGEIFQPELEIVDNDSLSTPPILIPDDGNLMTDVIIDLRAHHTWIGDLKVRVFYDPDCGGPAAEIDAIILCRPGRPCGVGTGFGCSSNMGTGAQPALSCNPAGPYLFNDDSPTQMAVPVCPGDAVNIAPGCFRPTSTISLPLSRFDNLRKGGCFRLSVSDNAGGDTGGVCEWSVHLFNEPPVSTTVSSWGKVKSIYR